LPAGRAEHRIEYVRRKLAATLVATIASAVFVVPFLARDAHTKAAGDARSGSAIVASRF
jgi:hypothetical protein